MEELLSFWPWTVDPWQTSVIWQAHYFFQAFLIFQHQTNGLLVVFICGCWLFSVWQNILVVKIVRYKVTLLFWSFLWPVLIPGCHIATFFHAPSVPLANVLSLPRWRLKLSIIEVTCFCPMITSGVIFEGDQNPCPSGCPPMTPSPWVNCGLWKWRLKSRAQWYHLNF